MTRSLRLVAILALVACVPILAVVAAQTSPQASAQAQPPSPGPAQPASLAGFEDQGAFHLYINEDPIGTITFRWLADGTFENEAVLTLGGQSTKMTDSIAVDKDGRWVKMTSRSAVADIESVRDGDDVRITVKGKTQTTKLKADARVFSNYGPRS